MSRWKARANGSLGFAFREKAEPVAKPVEGHPGDGQGRE